MHRSPSDGYLTCYRCAAELPDGAAFCLECGAEQARPVHGYAVRRHPRTLLVAGVAGGGLLAILGGVLVALLLTGPEDSASLSPSASASADVTASPATPGPLPSPTIRPAAVLANRAIVSVATDALNLRARPDDSATILAELATGHRLFVIGEPTAADDLRWYRVGTTVMIPRCTGACVEMLIGFVATPTEEADAWLEAVDLDCPQSPMTADDLALLAPLEWLSCYGHTEIVVSGRLAYVEYPDEAGPIAYSPYWLASPYSPAYLRPDSGGSVAEFRARPASGPDEVPPQGEVVRVTGHFEDPDAPSCRASVNEAYWDAVGQSPQPVQLVDPARLVLDCRARFVWTDYEVIGQ